MGESPVPNREIDQRAVRQKVEGKRGRSTRFRDPARRLVFSAWRKRTSGRHIRERISNTGRPVAGRLLLELLRQLPDQILEAVAVGEVRTSRDAVRVQ